MTVFLVFIYSLYFGEFPVVFEMESVARRGPSKSIPPRYCHRTAWHKLQEQGKEKEEATGMRVLAAAAAATASSANVKKVRAEARITW